MPSHDHVDACLVTPIFLVRPVALSNLLSPFTKCARSKGFYVRFVCRSYKDCETQKPPIDQSSLIATELVHG